MYLTIPTVEPVRRLLGIAVMNRDQYIHGPFYFQQLYKQLTISLRQLNEGFTDCRFTVGRETK